MSELKTLPLDQLHPNPWNRTVFDPQALEELTASIKAEGIRESLIVRPMGPDQYQISSGNRRWLAAQKAGLTVVPCVIEELTDEQVAKDNIVLNDQREGISAMELSNMLAEYNVRFNKDQEKMAVDFGKTQAWISTYLGFQDLDPAIKNITAVIFSMSDLRAIKKLTPEQQKQIATELQSGILKPENVQKRANQLHFTRGVARGKLNHPLKTPALDPLANEWKNVEAQTQGWTWGVDYPEDKIWTFDVNLSALLPDDLPAECDPKKSIGQWFLAMAGALGAAQVDHSTLQKVDVAQQVQTAYADMVQRMQQQFERSARTGQPDQSKQEEPSEEEQLKMADELAAKFGKIL